jgi:hypothetical protein
LALAGPPPPAPGLATPLKLRALYWNKVARQPNTVWDDLAPVEPLGDPFAATMAQLFAVGCRAAAANDSNVP